MKPLASFLILAAAALSGAFAQDPAPSTSIPAEATWQALAPGSDGATPLPSASFRLRAEIVPDAAPGPPALRIGIAEIPLPDLDSARVHALDLTFEHPPGAPALHSVVLDGRPVTTDGILPLVRATAHFTSTPEEARETYRLDGDITLFVRFRTTGSGTLVSRCLPDGQDWVPDAKALFVRGGRLVYDIGWLGALSGGPRVDDGEEHVAVLVVENGTARLHVDGDEVAAKPSFTSPDPDGHVFKTGRAAPNFGGRFEGKIDNVRFYRRALDPAEVATLISSPDATNTPLLNWSPPASESPTLTLSPHFRDARIQPLGPTPHADLIAAWDDASLARGGEIYRTLCVTCHGDLEVPGSLPTAPVFQSGTFRNGADPFRLFQTLTAGYGQMVPQAQYTDRQKYDVIHYLRETFFEGHNPEAYTEITPAYLGSLPKALASAPAPEDAPGDAPPPPYQQMDFGRSLFWTYQVAPENIAYKGIAVRLDPGPGGVSRGRAWIVYDHDTLRVAAAYTGSGNPADTNFIDWRGIAFDGSHGTHSAIVGDILFTNPVGPGVAQPKSGSWDDPRFLGRDDRAYGPLPRDWAQFRGLFHHGDHTVLHYTVGKTDILELPGLVEYGAAPLFTRTLRIGASDHDLTIRLAPDSVGIRTTVAGSDAARLTTSDGFATLHVPAAATPTQLTVFLSAADPATHDALARAPDIDLATLTAGGSPRWETGAPITTTATTTHDEAPWAVDDFPVPDLASNPWHSWMRLGGFDFDPDDPNKAAVCTWMGDVWTVEGIAAAPPSTLTWRRIASGLFQPLGLKFRDGNLFVTCRDQLAELRDLNGDGEIDHIRTFNNDHQVTEHFHEFAMGLQSDADGNFYYAKSARHALEAVIPHHGTLLKVSADGSETTILATGFRAANGVCLNPDGSFIVTDQEGHWNPKNRINYVNPGGFYGNMFGYHDVDDPSDEAMEKPLCWITNSFDRSPSELLWVPADAAWGALNGSLLNLSYGYGKVYVVPHEIVPAPDGRPQAQGGMCALPIPDFPTGIMRGRFSPADGQLYTCGLFAWGGARHQPGGFYRLRHTGGAPQNLPVGIEARSASLSLTFTDPLDPNINTDPPAFEIRAWDLDRSRNYGSKHLNERPLTIAAATLSDDRHTVTLAIPDLAPSRGLALRYRLTSANGTPVENEIHHTVHHLAP
ncbi:hypothetical protein BH23VER1_BH23VER1_22090 [soil metagenome]